MRPITQILRDATRICRVRRGREPGWPLHVIANRPARWPVVRLPRYRTTFVYGSRSSKTKYRRPIAGWLSTTGPLPRSSWAIEYSVSTFGATTVRSPGRANVGALLNALTGASPIGSGHRTLVVVARTRRNSSSGKP